MVLGRLNHAVAGKLVSSVDILRDSYTGTLTRCLESLETLDRDSPEEAKTTDALKQILNAAYQVEITVRSSSSFIKNLLEKMKQLVQSMPWKAPPVICREWKEKVAEEMLGNLSESRLARSISSQIKERLNKSHEQFSSALRQLEMRHSGRLDKIEEHRLKLRKVHAPRLAKMALESTSLRDVTLFGMPHMGREIGRGQYGVVYSCDSWGSHSPCAIKSVVPPDDKHWNDLALEFFYTKNIPEHPRIVMLRGSVIDYMYGGGTSPAVLLIMDRLQKDLYTAIKQGLDWVGRLQVSIDVVEGLRYLHSQGLVHRDVKLKNVLLDRDNRGRITDLGFCKPEAMMSGSIVGTPIHMAPELFTGHYDNSVDVYAFGILFWYVCAGHVRLPSAFEQCANKDQLWQSVKKGLRPEQPVNCSEDCWTLMKGCWEGDPSRRPFFGDVEVSLKNIVEKYKRKMANSKGSGSDRKSRGHSPRHKSSSQYRSKQIPASR
ncbi:dual serine/threonine and tyrosine protein kinase [Elysia marginata]|uniref:Dual serine/threonine and tyrosine protein kinase n=1 Tax=Elysia marginata TaxID=1093978 RepID=A0AAV4HHA6_9GAST|nr:dual serine/threonine and tyrosine protein kinase [Elysia marginata]